MKILSAGDLHGDAGIVKKLAEKSGINLKNIVTDGGASTLSALTDFTRTFQACFSLSSFDLIKSLKIFNCSREYTR